MDVVEPIRDLAILGRFLDFLQRRRQRDYVMAMTGINTGLRVSDWSKLTVQDVAGSHLVIRQTKTGKRVRVPLNDVIRGVLDDWTKGMDPKDFLFQSREGWNKPITRSRAYQILNEAAAAVGLERIGTHSLRKTFGYHYYLKTKDIATLMELLGHQDPSVTRRYIGIIDRDVDRAMRGFSLGK